MKKRITAQYKEVPVPIDELQKKIKELYYVLSDLSGQASDLSVEIENGLEEIEKVENQFITAPPESDEFTDQYIAYSESNEGQANEKNKRLLEEWQDQLGNLQDALHNY